MKLVKPLSVKEVQALKNPGRYTLGGVPGLMLQIDPAGNKLYVYRYVVRTTGKRTVYSIGSASSITLKDAREIAASLRSKVEMGVDLSLDRKETKRQAVETIKKQQLEQEIERHSFRYCAEQFIEERSKSGYWRNNVRGESVIAGYLRRHINPVIGDIPISKLTAQDVFEVLKPIWQTTTDAAPYSRTIIFHVFRWSKAKGWCDQENPADTKGVLGVLLEPLNPGRKKVRNMPALDFRELPDFMAELLKSDDVTYKLTAFSILTCLRSKMARLIKWDDIDFKNKTLTIPEDSNKTKGKGEHTVFLSDQALEILNSMTIYPGVDWVFPSKRKMVALTDAAMSSVFRRLHAKKFENDGIGWVDPVQTEKLGKPVIATQHGTARACFKTWSKTGENRKLMDEDAVELCMAHGLKDDYDGAYNRAELESERRYVMQSWADFLLPPSK